MARKYIDCREYPSEMNCTLAIAADSEKEVPRNVVPQAAPDSDPFRYRDPNAN